LFGLTFYTFLSDIYKFKLLKLLVISEEVLCMGSKLQITSDNIYKENRKDF